MPERLGAYSLSATSPITNHHWTRLPWKLKNAPLSWGVRARTTLSTPLTPTDTGVAARGPPISASTTRATHTPMQNIVSNAIMIHNALSNGALGHHQPQALPASRSARSGGEFKFRRRLARRARTLRLAPANLNLSLSLPVWRCPGHMAIVVMSGRSFACFVVCAGGRGRVHERPSQPGQHKTHNT